MAKLVDTTGLEQAFKNIKNDMVSKVDTVIATPTDLDISLKIGEYTSTDSIKSISPNTVTTFWTSTNKYTGMILVSFNMYFANKTGGNVRSCKVNGFDCARISPCLSGATYIPITTVVRVSNNNITLSASHDYSSALTCGAVGGVRVIKLTDL